MSPISLREALAQLASARKDMRRLRIIAMGLLNDLNRKDGRIIELEAILAAAVTGSAIPWVLCSSCLLPRELPGESRGGVQGKGDEESRGGGSKGADAGGSKKRKLM